VGDSFAGTIGQDVGLKEMAIVAEQMLRLRIVRVKEAGVIQVFVDPGFQVFELAEIDYEAIAVGLDAGKSQCNPPIMAVDQCAVSVVAVLAVGERDVAVGFFAS
jgi:hypothetical protein